MHLLKKKNRFRGRHRTKLLPLTIRCANEHGGKAVQLILVEHVLILVPSVL